MSISVEVNISIYEIDRERMPPGTVLTIRSGLGGCVNLVIGGHTYEVSGIDLRDAVQKAII